MPPAGQDWASQLWLGVATATTDIAVTVAGQEGLNCEAVFDTKYHN